MSRFVNPAIPYSKQPSAKFATSLAVQSYLQCRERRRGSRGGATIITCLGLVVLLTHLGSTL